MNSPLVSICIPTYNRPDCLRRVVESCLAQTYPHFEIFITDNSTNDQTAKLALTWTDPRIHYHSNGGDIGSTESANLVLSMATGKYIKYLMDDDLIKPRALEKMVKVMEENPTVGLVTAPMELIGEHFERIYPKFYLFQTMRYRFRYQVGDGFIERRRILRDYLTGVRNHKPSEYPCVVPSGFLMRAEAYQREGGSTREMQFAGDLALCMRLACYWDFYYIDEVLSSWRFIPQGHTVDLQHRGFPIKVFYLVAREFLRRPVVQEMFRDGWDELARDTLYFASCRSLLNVVAGIRARNAKLIMETLRIIMREDRFVYNWLRLPLFALREVFVSLFPQHDPPARE